MSWSLPVLLVSAFVVVAVSTSAVIGVALPWLDRLAEVFTPRHRARFWLGLAALPVAVGALTVMSALLPALGFGSDHCLVHDLHHPHLCPHHMAGTPGTVVVSIAVLAVLRAIQVALTFARVARLSQVTSHALAEGSNQQGDLLVFDSDAPQAFVLGLVSPRVHASRGLLELGKDVIDPVLAHESVHATHRDLLWRALCPVMAFAHLPSVTKSLGARLATAQEMAADRAAADELGDPVCIAEAILTLARLSAVPAPGLSFTHGDLGARVVALLHPSPAKGPWPLRLFLGCSLIAATTIGMLHEAIHHGLETLLGALS